MTGPSRDIGTYTYDGDGKRITKVAGLVSTVFFYDAFGKLVEEAETTQPVCQRGASCDPITVTTSYIYAGSRLLSTETPSGTNYLTADHLGSPRINTDASGNVTARHDYMPFGEEISTSQRTSGVGYVGDTVRKKFTGYERDVETGLDFAEARMSNSMLGRLLTPDPYNVIFEKENGESKEQRSQIFVGFLSNPQRWNAYIYVINNPLAFVDPDGHQPKTINVFVGLANKNGMKEWQDFAKKAKEKGITVNIYTVGKKGGTAGDFINSIKAKDTVTIFAGHSASVGEQHVGIHFGPSGSGSDVANKARGLSNTADGVDVKNDIVAVFSCGFGNGFSDVTSSNGAAFVYIAQGNEDTCQTDSVNGAALLFAKSVVELDWSESALASDFKRSSNLEKATSRATDAMTKFGKYSQNEGDKVKYRILPKKGGMFR